MDPTRASEPFKGGVLYFCFRINVDMDRAQNHLKKEWGLPELVGATTSSTPTHHSSAKKQYRKTSIERPFFGATRHWFHCTSDRWPLDFTRILRPLLALPRRKIFAQGHLPVNPHWKPSTLKTLVKSIHLRDSEDLFESRVRTRSKKISNFDKTFFNDQI